MRESLVLLKNAGSVLPLKPGARILVAGDGADNIAKQAGGWTLSWQGTGTQPSSAARRPLDVIYSVGGETNIREWTNGDKRRK